MYNSRLGPAWLTVHTVGDSEQVFSFSITCVTTIPGQQFNALQKFDKSCSVRRRFDVFHCSITAPLRLLPCRVILHMRIETR